MVNYSKSHKTNANRVKTTASEIFGSTFFIKKYSLNRTAAIFRQIWFFPERIKTKIFVQI